MIQGRSVDRYVYAFNRRRLNFRNSTLRYVLMHSRSFKYFYNAFIITLSRKYRDRVISMKRKKKIVDPSRKLIRKGGRELISVAQGTSVNTLSSTYPSRERKKKKKRKGKAIGVRATWNKQFSEDICMRHDARMRHCSLLDTDSLSVPFLLILFLRRLFIRRGRKPAEESF